MSATVFYACEIDDRKSEFIYECVVKQFCAKYGFNLYRADKHSTIGHLDDQIFGEIASSALFLAEMSSNNSNVFIELGFAYCAIGPSRIILFQHGEVDLPFDIKQQNTIPYRLDGNYQDETAGKVLSNIDRFFKRPDVGLTFSVGKDSSSLSHFPKDRIISFYPWSGNNSDGGFSLRDKRVIVVDHVRSTGNWSDTRDPQNSSVMRLVPVEKSKGLHPTNTIRVSVRCRKIGLGDANLTIAIDGGRNSFGEKCFVPRSTEVVPSEEVEEIVFDPLSLELVTTGDFPNQFVSPKEPFDITELGLGMFLGVYARDCNVEIYEILLEVY